MLYLAESVMAGDFVAKAHHSLMLVYDERNRTSHLGWVTEVKLGGGVVYITMDHAVVQRHGTTEWEGVTNYAFAAEVSDSPIPLEESGGPLYSDCPLTHPTFRILTEAVVPALHARPLLVLVSRAVG